MAGEYATKVENNFCLTYLMWVVQKDFRWACLTVDMKAGMRVQMKAVTTAYQRY